MRGEREREVIYRTIRQVHSQQDWHCTVHSVHDEGAMLFSKITQNSLVSLWTHVCSDVERPWNLIDFEKKRETEATITGHTTCHYPQLWRIDTLEGRGENWTNTGGWRYGHREEHILCVTVIISSSHTTVIHVQTSRRRSMPTLRLLRMDIVVEDEFLRRSWGWSCNYCKCSWSLTLIRDKGFRVCLLFGFLRGWDSVTVSLHNVHSNGMWE